MYLKFHRDWITLVYIMQILNAYYRMHTKQNLWLCRSLFLWIKGKGPTRNFLMGVRKIWSDTVFWAWPSSARSFRSSTAASSLHSIRYSGNKKIVSCFGLFSNKGVCLHIRIQGAELGFIKALYSASAYVTRSGSPPRFCIWQENLDTDTLSRTMPDAVRCRIARERAMFLSIILYWMPDSVRCRIARETHDCFCWQALGVSLIQSTPDPTRLACAYIHWGSFGSQKPVSPVSIFDRETAQNWRKISLVPRERERDREI